MRRIKWSLVFYSLLGILFLVGIVLLMSLVSSKADSQKVSALKIVVEGKETFIDQNDISKMVNNQFGTLEDKLFKDVKVEQIEKAIKKLPYVSDAEVYADVDGVVKVKVVQREAILRVINRTGKEFYIDTEGKKIPVTLKYVPHVLVANGNIKEGYAKALDTIQTNVVKDLVKLVNRVAGDPLWENQIVQIYVNEQNDIELIPRVGNETLLLGSAEGLDDKLSRLEIYYKNILPKVGTEAYEKVNVKYEGQIICERKGNYVLDSLQMNIKRN